MVRLGNAARRVCELCLALSKAGNAQTSARGWPQVGSRRYGVQYGYHKFFDPTRSDPPGPCDTKSATRVLVESLRSSPVETAMNVADSLTPAERGALVHAFRRKNVSDGISDAEEAFLEADRNMSSRLSREEFTTYLAIRREQLRRKQGEASVREPPGARQLLLVSLASGIPFIGFGFCDNAVMLLAGQRIETSLGVVMGISTLGAAGLGNAISDVVGLGLADSIQAQAARWGFFEPPLSFHQKQLFITRMWRTSGAVIGVTTGCLLGMIPLLFFDKKPKPKPCSSDDVVQVAV